MRSTTISSATTAAIERTIVLGGSLAGLLAARVMAAHSTEVVIIDRDVIPDEASTRRGVPQARHAHGLLARGHREFGRWFPGLDAALAERGALFCDLGADAHWWHFDGLKTRFESDLVGPFMSRALFDHEVRQRVLALPNVTMITGTEARGLLASADRRRVTGVALESRDGTNRRRFELTADLVVDATGRGSRMPEWLSGLGYERPTEDRVTVNAGYTSRIYRREAGDLPHAKVAYALPTPPAQTRMGALFPIEGDRWMVSLGGWSGDHATPDEAGFLAFARSLPIPEIARVIERAEPLSDFAVHKFPAGLRRRYERLSRIPDGLVVMGDAVCSFNPIYGQGMTVSALEASALDECVRAGAARGAATVGLGRRFFRRAAGLIDTPWQMAVGEDFRFRETTGERPRGLGLVHWYTERVHRAAHRDPVVCLAFYRTMNLLAPPASLFHPRVAVRLLRHAWAPRRAAAPGPAAAGPARAEPAASAARRPPMPPSGPQSMATTGR